MSMKRSIWRLSAAGLVVVAMLGAAKGQDDYKVQADSRPVAPAKLTEANPKLADEGFVIGPEDLLRSQCVEGTRYFTFHSGALRWKDYASARRRTAGQRKDSQPTGTGNRRQIAELHLGA